MSERGEEGAPILRARDSSHSLFSTVFQALIVWRQGYHFSTQQRRNDPEDILEIIHRTSPRHLIGVDKRLMKYFISLAAERPDSNGSYVLQRVASIACSTQAPELWCHAMDLCHGTQGVAALGVNGAEEALAHLGMEVVLPR